ncbi:MAG TPA: hypothetical protein VN937_13870 [Blastocatellia bacterium]|nr:hypothetical protein [Blastocatellia bacterium]
MQVQCVRAPLLSLLAFFLGASAFGRPPLEGERNDEHGNIHWKSTAESQVQDSETLWTYDRFVENRDIERKCHVNWKPAKWSGTIDPSKIYCVGHATTDMPPDRQEGVILYNGKHGTGEGPPAAAPVWDPTETKVKGERLIERSRASSVAESPESKVIGRSIEATALIAFDVNDVSYRSEIRASSRLITLIPQPNKDLYQLSYRVTLSRNLPKMVLSLRWDSVESIEWNKLVGIEAVQAGKYLEFDAKNSFTATLTTSNRPVFRSQSIRFLDSGGRLLAEAWLPAFASPK